MTLKHAHTTTTTDTDTHIHVKLNKAERRKCLCVSCMYGVYVCVVSGVVVCIGRRRGEVVLETVSFNGKLGAHAP